MWPFGCRWTRRWLFSFLKWSWGSCVFSIYNQWLKNFASQILHALHVSLRYGTQQSSSKDLISFWASLNYCNNYQPHLFGDGPKLCLLNGRWNDNAVHYQSSIISLASFLKVKFVLYVGMTLTPKMLGKTLSLVFVHETMLEWESILIQLTNIELKLIKNRKTLGVTTKSLHVL